MRSIDDIKYICSDRFNTSNKIVARGIYKKITNENIPLVMAIHKLVNLKEEFYGTENQEELFKLLNNNNYNYNFEIITLIKSLFKMDKKEINYTKNKYINSPYINSVELNNGKYIISCNDSSIYRVENIDSYLAGLNINPTFLNGTRNKECYKNTSFVVKKCPVFYATVSFCKPMFSDGSYYHSYCIDQVRNKVLDPTYKIVMKKEEYEQLFGTEEIFKIKGFDLYRAYNMAIEHKIELKFYDEVIAATLFQQYIWENELPSPNNKIYTNEPSNQHLLVKNR